MQDNQLHANLSVEEAMHVATSLKLGSDISKDSKYQVVSVRTLCANLIQGHLKAILFREIKVYLGHQLTYSPPSPPPINTKKTHDIVLYFF